MNSWKSRFFVINNTCDSSFYYGIGVFGVASQEQTEGVFLNNNIVSDSGIGLVLTNGWLNFIVANTGYFGNGYAGGGDRYGYYEWEEYNPVYEYEMPYVYGPTIRDICYLRQDCNFINKSNGYIEQTRLIGKTTDINGLPDSGFLDLGFHYPAWDYSNAGDGNDVNLSGSDLNGDNIVNFIDFAFWAVDWQSVKDIFNLSEFCDDWLKTANGRLPIAMLISGDANNLNGDIEVSVNILDNTLTRVFLLVDGKKCSEYQNLEENPVEILKTQYYQNGRHEIKIAAVDVNHIVYSSKIIDVNFQNIISSLSKESYFNPGQPLRIKALGQGNFNVSIYDIINETETYSNDSNGQINITIPAEAFPEDYGVYDFTLSSQDYPSSPPVKSLVRRKPVPTWVTKMVVSIADEELQNAKRRCWRGALMAGVRKGFAPAVVVPEDGDEWFNYLTRVLSSQYCKIWYHLGHGNYRTMFVPWNPDRTFIATPSGPVFSYLRKDLNPVPPDYQNVWGYEECDSIAGLGLANTDKMIWVQINACYSARNPDFAQAIGIPTDDPIGTQIYIGWRDSARVYDLISKFNQFEETLWQYLGMGSNLQDSFDEATTGFGWNQIIDNFTTYGVIDWQFVWFRYPSIN